MRRLKNWIKKQGLINTSNFLFSYTSSTRSLKIFEIKRKFSLKSVLKVSKLLLFNLKFNFFLNNYCSVYNMYISTKIFKGFKKFFLISNYDVFMVSRLLHFLFLIFIFNQQNHSHHLYGLPQDFLNHTLKRV